MKKIDSGVIKQIILLLLIAFIGIEMIVQLKYFIPGFLGAFTLYVLFRNWCFYLIEKKHWKKWMTALAMILGCLILFVFPVWAIVNILSPRISFLFANTDMIKQKISLAINYINTHVVAINLSDADFKEMIQKAAVIVPKILNATASVLSNLAIAFFIFYFMVIGGRKMENRVQDLLPLNDQNKMNLWKETQKMVVSNAIGIPVLATTQALFAMLGYWIFGVDDFVVWGLLTGAAFIIPVIGTLLVWGPVCILTFATGHTGQGIGLLIYCIVILSNIDNVLRFTLMKKLGDVHPLITVFGVIIGVKLFGLMGLIFGPLLISYFILLAKIYRIEFGLAKNDKTEE